MAFPKAIITKPILITTAEYQEVGQNIALVGYDEASIKMQESKSHASPRLLNWIEPYQVGGERKTLFYTEVNSNIKAGDKVFIINGSYDSNLLIKKDKYKKGRDGYTVLKVDGCKIALDIDYTGAMPYKEDSIDDFIKVYYIDSEETFLAANRQMTSRDGKVDYKFNYGQNNIAFIDKSYGPIEQWGRNGGVYGVPGFFVREENSYLNSGGQVVSIREQWNNISDKLVYLGSFSVALSSAYKNNGKMLVMNGSFEYEGIEFREGVAYKWNDSANRWEADVEYSVPIISKSNFRSGTFKGKFNGGAYGSLDKKISWTGAGIWNGGTIMNSKWEKGTMNSLISISPSLKAEKDQYGIPFQKPNTSNNAGFGFNYAIGCDMESSVIQNGNFLKTKFVGSEGTFSVVEEHILGMTHSYDNEVVKAFFESCEFRNIHVKSGEIKNAKAFNSRFTNIKALNSYFEQSVLKDSTYIGDGVIKILGYDEWNISEYRSRNSGTYSYINTPNSKVYKFYISKESFERLKAKDVFYIKGLKIKDSSRDMLLDFFDSKFKLSSWTAYYDDLSYGANHAFFYKRGYEIAAFLSTPEENAYSVSSYEEAYRIGGTGSTFLKYRTEAVGPNPNKGYSIDIVASRHDVANKSATMDTTSDKYAPITRDYNYGTDVATATASMPNYIGSMVDITGAYIIDANFESGIVETSDWNSGYHINYSNDVALSGATSTGRYAMSIDVNGDYLIVNTPFNKLFPEKSVEDSMLQSGDVVFLNSVDYDNRGMVTTVTIMATGSSYSTTSSSNPTTLVNTKVSGTTMSATGSGYFTGYDIETITKVGSGSGLRVDIMAYPIGSVMSITYSPPLSSGGSYSVSSTMTSPAYPGAGPVPTGSFTEVILTDTTGSITGVPGATYTAAGGITQTYASASMVVNAIFATGPDSNESGLTVRYYTLANGSIYSLSVENPGMNYLPGQIFKIEGGNSTFSVASISYGEIYSYSISNPGEDYIIGDAVDIYRPFDPNSSVAGATASITITAITASYFDSKGLSLEIEAGTGPMEGKIVGLTISNPGMYYAEGEIFTILGGNLDALVRIDSVTGSMTRLNDAYKVVDNAFGKIKLQELGTQSIVAGLTGGGIFYTSDANNRWNYMSKTRIDRSKIKSGIFRRPYITRSLIRDASYSSQDKDFLSKDKIKNLLVADAIFSSNGNILSSATYMHSIFCAGSDIWNDGIIFRSLVNGMTFSKGTVRNSMWLKGTFNGGTFYDSRSFDARPSIYERNYKSDSLYLYYVKGEIKAGTDPVYNGRYAWQDGTFNGGEFFKSDWNAGSFNGGLFYNSKFYDGTINGGVFGTKNVDALDTKVYNATVNNTTVNNAYFYADDSSYSGLSYSLITWNNGNFNGGVFGSNNTRVFGSTISTTSFKASIGALPIKDFKLTEVSLSVTDTNPITGDFEIEATVTLKHTYIGDLIINLMSPNGKIINLKRRYSGGSNDNMISSVFTSDADAPSIDIWTAPYTGTFKMERKLGEGVYYNLRNISERGPYKAPKKELPSIVRYSSVMPAVVYDGDRYLAVGTASDPLWSGQTVQATSNSHVAGKLFDGGLRNRIVEYKSNGSVWIFPTDDSGRVLDDPEEGDQVMTSSAFGAETLTYYRGKWTKSYHSNTTKISEMLNSNKTVTGNWKLLVMDDAGIDIGFIDDFLLSFTYKNSYLIRSYKNDAIWNDGIFNGGQFIDLAIWRKGTFNGGKFISTYGWTSSGDYLKPDAISESYTWQDGVFNGGEFGNESLQANSTWNKGEFNGGIFKGRLWNDGIFTYGEFKGGSKLPAVGGGIRSESANAFIDEFRTGSYYGVWRKGNVSEKKDEFVTDKKMSTPLERAVKPVVKGRNASFSNMLWLGGTFNHQAGEIKESVWLDGLFKKGKMLSSAFNPYVVRYGDIKEFNKDDSSIWEDGFFSNGEFHYSKWMQGKFISGTAVGMVWKNGVANYMNAYNVFWENGLWRNGNWNGSMFEYEGRVVDGMAREILNRGIEWSGTSSCHIWNIFESDADRTRRMVASAPVSSGGIAADSFATDNIEDLGVAAPYFTNPANNQLTGPGVGTNFTISGNTITFNVTVNGNGATLSSVGIVWTSALAPGNAGTPIVTVNPGNYAAVFTTGLNSGGQVYNGISPALTSIAAADGSTSLSISVPGLDSSKWYNFMAFAINRDIVTTAVSTNVRTTLPLRMTQNDSTITGLVAPNTWSSTGNISFQTAYADPNTASAPTATLAGVYWIADPGSSTVATWNNTWNATTESYPSVGDIINGQSVTITTIPNNNFTVNISNSSLAGNTKYWYQPWIKNPGSLLPVYGKFGSFTTGKLVPQITFTAPGTSATSTSLSISVTNRGSATVKYGFVIWKATGTQPSPAELGSTSGATKPAKLAQSVAYSLSGGATIIYLADDTTAQGAQSLTLQLSATNIPLEPNTTYNVVAYAIDTTDTTLNVVSPSVSSPGQFKTALIPATVTSQPATVPTFDHSTPAAGITLNGNVTSTGGSTITYKGFVYRKSSVASYPAITPTIGTIGKSGNADSGIISINTALNIGAFTFQLDGLTPDTAYKFKSFVVTNGPGSPTQSATEQTFTTLATVTVSNRSNTATNALRLLSATVAGGGQIEVSTVGGQNFNPLTTLLTAGTKYYIRYKVTNAGGTNYYPSNESPWNWEQAVTLADISVSTPPPSITSTSVTAKVDLVSASSYTSRGIVYWPSSAPASKTVVDMNQSGDFVGTVGTKTVSGLATGTQYTYVGYADEYFPSGSLPSTANPNGWAANTDGVSGKQRTYTNLINASNKQEFWTKATIVFSSAPTIAATTLSSAITIANAGGSGITEWGVIWKQQSSNYPADFTQAEADAAVANTSNTSIYRRTTGSVLTSVTDTWTNPVTVASGDLFKVCAYVVNNSGVSISAQVSVSPSA